ncbi:MAG: hypothetical protein DRP47_10780 [Candidatus Zixiibacteriota bacterium]|nr:MAG: hypothetical protein DRP47_10780 [candidate division Zixibacteria bacterium]
MKSAFAPLYDSNGIKTAVLGVEASVDYFDALSGLKENLYYSTVLSMAGGLVLGIIFLLIQRSINRLQQHLFLNETQSYLGRMVAVVSHELKNPLAIIRASAERLKKKHSSPESVFVIEEVDRLNEIVSGYLDFAGAGATNMAGLNPEEFNLSDLVGNIKKHFRDKYPYREISWTKETIPDKVFITGYSRGLRQVLLNLLINGADSCLAAGRPIKVGVAVVDSEKTVTLTVIDHGPGIPRKHLKRIFEPFYTTRQAGSGLGLHLSKKIVEEMGGKIIIKSKEQIGTEVVVTLPKHPT